MGTEPFMLDLDAVLNNKAPGLYKATPRFVLNYLKRKIHIEELNEILRIYADKDGVDFAQSCVEYFNLDLKVNGLDNIPSDGRFVFVSNHPLGGLDGICLSAVIGEKYDRKIKYLVNDVLLFIKNLQSIFVPINKYGSQSRDSATLINEAYESDNQIITFPAGLCSRKIGKQICDLEWKKNFIQKAIETKRDVIPVYFGGYNSKFFYRFANIRKRLGIKVNIELFFLPDEMFKNKNNSFEITFGKPIPYTSFDNSRNALQWAQYVKELVYMLKKNK